MEASNRLNWNCRVAVAKAVQNSGVLGTVGSGVLPVCPGILMERWGGFEERKLTLDVSCCGAEYLGEMVLAGHPGLGNDSKSIEILTQEAGPTVQYFGLHRRNRNGREVWTAECGMYHITKFQRFDAMWVDGAIILAGEQQVSIGLLKGGDTLIPQLDASYATMGYTIGMRLSYAHWCFQRVFRGLDIGYQEYLQMLG